MASLIRPSRPMGKIIKTLEVVGDRGTLSLPVLFDSGASASFIRQDLAEKIALTSERKTPPKRFFLADGQATLSVHKSCDLDLKLDPWYLDGQFYVSEKLFREMIVGVDFMQKWGLLLDLKNKEIQVTITPDSLELV